MGKTHEALIKAETEFLKEFGKNNNRPDTRKPRRLKRPYVALFILGLLTLTIAGYVYGRRDGKSTAADVKVLQSAQTRNAQLDKALILKNHEIAELEKLAAKNAKKDRSNAHIHNILGYLYHAEGDKAKAKAHLDKYLELRPDGYNAYDSMGEYYFNEGDMEKALTYYKKARMHYPAATSARDKIKEIEDKMEAKKE